jgi:hypothetical protein
MPVSPLDQPAMDAIRGNIESIALPNAVRKATTSSADLVNPNAAGVIVYFAVSAVPGTDTVTLTIEAKDPASGLYSALYTAPPISTITRPARYILYPGVVGVAPTMVLGLPLPRTWRVTVLHSAATNFTYSVGCAYCL